MRRQTLANGEMYRHSYYPKADGQVEVRSFMHRAARCSGGYDGEWLDCAGARRRSSKQDRRVGFALVLGWVLHVVNHEDIGGCFGGG